MAFNSETTRVITAVLKYFWAQQDSESHFKQVSFLLGYIYNYSREDKKSGCKRNVYARLQTWKVQLYVMSYIPTQVDKNARRIS